MTSILYVDSLDSHEKEKNAMVITPNHLNLADAFQKDAFDKIIIQNAVQHMGSVLYFCYTKMT